MKGNFTTVVQNVVRVFTLCLGLTLSDAAAPVPSEAVVSDLSLKRADYTSVLKSKGFDDLRKQIKYAARS